MTASKMLAAARKDLGLVGRPNHITREYAARNGREFLDAAWCNMAVTDWARESGNAAAVLPEGDRAYTVYSAQDGERQGLWYAGTAANIKRYAKPGAVLFMDWGGSDRIGMIDHIGVVEVNLGDGRVQSIEGNTGDACKRRVRASDVIAGFWNPPYTDKDFTEALVAKMPLLKLGSKGNAVRRLFYLLISHGRKYALDPAVHSDTELTPALMVKFKLFQKDEGLDVDGECGDLSWAKLILP